MLIRFYYVIDVNDPEQIYVGSTEKTLQERLNQHWWNRNSKNNKALSSYMQDKQKSDFEIFLIEEKDCTKLERQQVEDEWIQQMGLINKCRALKNPECAGKWHKEHPEYKKEYNIKLKKEHSEYNRQYYLKKKLLAQNIS